MSREIQRFALPREGLIDDPPGEHIVRYGAKREPPLIMPWVCAVCRDWTEAGSYAAGKCTRCGPAWAGQEYGGLTDTPDEATSSYYTG